MYIVGPFWLSRYTATRKGFTLCDTHQIKESGLFPDMSIEPRVHSRGQGDWGLQGGQKKKF